MAIQPEPDPVPATKLESPTITLASKTDSSFTISWEAIENAECYSVDFMGDVTDTESLEAGYSGLDPDVNTNFDAGGDGFPTPNYDYNAYPKARTFTFGLNLTF